MMKKITTLLLFVAVAALSKHSFAQAQQDTPPTVIKKQTAVDSNAKTTADTIKMYADSITKILKNAAAKGIDANAQKCEKKETNNLIIGIAFFVIMILLIYLFFAHLKRHGQRIGYQSIKLIGLILIFPGICILALVGGTDVLQGQTLAALLGTIAGYVLSREDDSKDTIAKDAKTRIAQLEAEVKTIKDDTITDLKTKNPNLVV